MKKIWIIRIFVFLCLSIAVTFTAFGKSKVSKTGNKIYFAGPMFSEGEKEYNLKIVKVLEENGYEVFLPHRDGIEAALLEGKTEQELVDIIFKKDIEEVLKADIVFCFLTEECRMRVPALNLVWVMQIISAATVL